MRSNASRTLSLLLALVALFHAACGSRSGLRGEPAPDVGFVDGAVDGRVDAPVDVPVDRPDVLPDVVVPRVDVVCPAAIRSTQSLTVPIDAMATSNVGLALTHAWTVERAPADSMARPMPADAPSTRFTFDTGGEWVLRFTARDTMGNSGTCTVRLEADPAIVLLCPNDQSNFQGATLRLDATARSRLMRPITLRWSVEERPMGSTSLPTPPDRAENVAFLLDQLGDWRLRLTATDSTGLSNACIVRLHADPDVIVACPANQASRPFATINLTARASSRTMRPLTYRWEIVSAPITSSAPIPRPDQISTPFTFDVAGDWTYRFTATNDRGNMAFCTTRALAASEEAVRVELIWNTDRSCRPPVCNERFGGHDIDLHLTDVRRAMNRWANAAPDNSDCFYGNCKCDRAVGMLCPNGVLEWDPAGAVNNPQLDIDNVGGSPTDGPGPENINVVQASTGTEFDVGVHYYTGGRAGSMPTPTVVRVYCGGSVVFESEAVRLGPGASGDNPSSNPLWLVGRVSVTPGGCTFTRCGRPGALTGCIKPQDEWNGGMGGGMGGGTPVPPRGG